MHGFADPITDGLEHLFEEIIPDLAQDIGEGFEDLFTDIFPDAFEDLEDFFSDHLLGWYHKSHDLKFVCAFNKNTLLPW